MTEMAERNLIVTDEIGSQNTRVNGANQPRIDHVTQPRCLQERTGTCGGCEILSMVLDKSQGLNPGDSKLVAGRISRQFCPTGNSMQLPSTRTRARLW